MLCKSLSAFLGPSNPREVSFSAETWRRQLWSGLPWYVPQYRGRFAKTDQSTATDLNSGKEVAVKLEHNKIDPSLLRDEYETYELLAGGKGIPKVHWFGRESEYRVMVFELLGPSLEDLFNYCGRLFSLKTVLMLADQIIARLQYIHSKNFIHQDIKPENFLMGMGGNGNCVYITDLGLASQFLPHEAPPAAHRSQFGLVGTANFASLNGHRGISRRTWS